MKPEDADAIRRYLTELARKAGEITLTYFRGDFEVERKADDSPVTRADRECEAFIRERLTADHPGDGVLGEEYGLNPGNGGRTWVVDPIDGTKSFVAGVPLYAVLIALVDGSYEGGEIETSRVLAGVIHIPALNETISAARGTGAIWDSQGRSRRARVSEQAQLAESRVATSDFADLHRREPRLAGLINEGAGMCRTWGDAYGYLLVATGRLDAMVDPIVSPWDIAPLPVILEEAGGCYTTVDGRAVLGTNALGCNAALHDRFCAPGRFA